MAHLKMTIVLMAAHRAAKEVTSFYFVYICVRLHLNSKNRNNELIFFMFEVNFSLDLLRLILPYAY